MQERVGRNLSAVRARCTTRCARCVYLPQSAKADGNQGFVGFTRSPLLLLTSASVDPEPTLSMLFLQSEVEYRTLWPGAVVSERTDTKEPAKEPITAEQHETCKKVAKLFCTMHVWGWVQTFA